MNFTPFGTTFSGNLPTGSTVAQFTTAKFAHQVGGGAGQVVGLLSADEAGVTYLRPVDANGFTLNLAQQTAGNNADNQQIITLPISVPGAKPGDLPQQQTLQIQVVNPGTGAPGTGEKYAVPLFQQAGATVLTLAYSNPHQDQNDPSAGATAIQLQLHHPDAEQVSHQTNNSNNNPSSVNSGEASSQTPTMHSDEIRVDGWDAQVLPGETKDECGASGAGGGADEGGGSGTGNQAFPVALVTHLPSELILRATEESITPDKDDISDKDKGNHDKRHEHAQADGGETFNGSNGGGSGGGGGGSASSGGGNVTGHWQPVAVPTTTMADYLSRLPPSGLPLSLHHFLKFSAETIKRESAIESSPLGEADPNQTEELDESQMPATEDIKGGKKKKKYKKKPPKPRRPRPGQVHIAVALDGTTLFCCPECNMAYPDKEMLEQHLVAHKIERRFICDICGAGLKRKEHLERHKLGHNPERPYICSVCCKGFKRKEHLNLHFVIHSGEKSEVCPECGKGFHRKDHLRKHARSHLAKRVKEEAIAVQGTVDETALAVGPPDNQAALQGTPPEHEPTAPILIHHQQPQPQQQQQQQQQPQHNQH